MTKWNLFQGCKLGQYFKINHCNPPYYQCKGDKSQLSKIGAK